MHRTNTMVQFVDVVKIYVGPPRVNIAVAWEGFQ